MADFLTKNGVQAHVIAPPEYSENNGKIHLKREYLRSIFSITANDVVILQNLIRNRRLVLLLFLLRIYKRPLMIFDLDDASYTNWPITTRMLVWMSDKVIVSSHHLARWKSIGSRPVLIMPNLVDVEMAERYRKNSGETDMPVLGWIGGAPDSIENLRMLVPVLTTLVQKNLRFIFRLVGTLHDDDVKHLFTDIPGLHVEFVESLEWQKEGEIQKANAAFDIGLCPLVDTEDNHARCSLKVLDYMAAGLPVVASPIGENTFFIKDGIHGFLPNTVDAWIDRLRTLILDANLRKQLGTAGFEKLKKEFSYQANIQKYSSFLSRG